METAIKTCSGGLNYNYIWIEIRNTWSRQKVVLACCIAFAKFIMIYPRLVPFYLLLGHVLIILLSTCLVIILYLIRSIYAVKFIHEMHFFTLFPSIYTELLFTHFLINIREENIKKKLTLAVESSCLVNKLIFLLWGPLWGLL